MGARVTLQVKGVIESLATERAEVAFDVGVAFEVPVQQAGQIELLPTDLTLERIVAGRCRLTRSTDPRAHQFVRSRAVVLDRAVVHAAGSAQEWVFDSVSSIHEFNRVQDVRGDP